MALNDIVFQKTNGGLGRPAANEDVISGLLMSMSGKMGDLPEELDVVGDLGIAKLNFYEQLATQYGIEETEFAGTALNNAEMSRNAVCYHVKEFFRMSPTGTLYLGVKLADSITKAEIKSLQYYAGGTIRQMGIFTKFAGAAAAAVAENEEAALITYQQAATELEKEHQPLSIVVARQKGFLTLASLTGTLSPALVVDGRCNVSLLVSCDLSPKVIAQLGDANFAYYGCIGNLLGCISKASVHESIAWVQKFPLGLSMPGFITGDLLKEVSTGNLSLINDNRFIFVRTHVGNANNYYNDTHTLDVPTSDYAFIESMRTMDKATRGIRTNMLPYLNAPLYVDADSGKLRADTVAFLEGVAGAALEDMEKAGELSGYMAVIDPEQNVLATSELQILIKNVPVGVMRMVKIKIGFTTQLS